MAKRIGSGGAAVVPPQEASGRVHLLKLRAKNIKSLRCVEIDEFGNELEIRGRTGQGKTSILEAIEGGLIGLDAGMVRQGEDAAEIVMELDTVRVSRIVRADGGKDVLTVTDRASGKSIDRAKEFLKALYPEKSVFRPMDFVNLGKGDAKGRTERLRQQRNILIDAMPVKLTAEDVHDAVKDLGEDVLAEAMAASLDGIDWEQHGLGVCSALEKVFYDGRKDVNARAEHAEAAVKHTLAPDRPAPKQPFAACKTAEQRALEAWTSARATQNARKGTMERAEQLRWNIAAAEAELPPREKLEAAIKQATDQGMARGGEIKELRAQIEELQRRVAQLEAEQSDAREQIAEAKGMVARWGDVARHRVELAEVEKNLGTAGEAVDVAALEKAYLDAQAGTKARELQDRHDAAVATATTARERAKRYDALVELFRDTLPKRIVQAMQMPVEGLSIAGDVVTYNGIPLHQLGNSQQYYVAVLLAAALNPRTGFVLIDQAECIGSEDRAALGKAARELGLQLILTYVDEHAKPGPGRVVMQGGEAVG